MIFIKKLARIDFFSPWKKIEKYSILKLVEPSDKKEVCICEKVNRNYWLQNNRYFNTE